MSRRVALVFALCLLPVPSAAASHATAVGVEGPDPDGAYLLSFDIHREAAGVVHLALDVTREDADVSASGAREVGDIDLSAGTSRQSIPFLPAEGPGHYTVALVMDGLTGPAVAFDVDDAGASVTVPFQVADEPTYVNLTNDSVNAEGKVKSPGDALLTRAVVSDANGLADLDALAWLVDRNGTLVAEGNLALPTTGTSASVEARFDRSPIDAGNYRLTLRAMRGGGVLAGVSRTFIIREVAPTFVSGTLAAVIPDAEVRQNATVVLADKNGLPDGALEPRVYRGSTRVEASGFAATLGTPTRLADADGAARWAYPLELRVPARAAAGAHRASIYRDGSLLGTLPFDVLPLPTLASVTATSVPAGLALEARGVGDGILLARLEDGHGASTLVSATFTNGSASVLLEPPRRGAALHWNASLRARADGVAVAWREGNWSAPYDGPALTLVPLHVRPRLPAVWALASAWSPEGANATISFTRWDGQPEPRLQGSLAVDRVRVEAETDLPAGRYGARVVLTWANGSASEASWSFDAGPWVELTLGDPVVNGRLASVAVHNSGSVNVTRLVVETEPRANLTLSVGNATFAPRIVGARARFDTVVIAAGEDAMLRIELPAGALRSGPHDVHVRVLARVDVG